MHYCDSCKRWGLLDSYLRQCQSCRMSWYELHNAPAIPARTLERSP